jgi:hypothetical integral membrane protein (TIGR02206 family)
MIPYSASHWAVLGVFVLGAILCWKVSLSPAVIERIGILTIGCFVAVEIYYGWPTHFTWQESIPLELCDVALLVCGLALYRRLEKLYPFVFFWGFVLSSQAFSTPILEYAFPHPVFFTFWIAHLLIVWTAIIVVTQFHYRPSWRELQTTIGWTLVYMALVFAINVALGANYMYLNAKPAGPTPLDYMGDWPVYVFIETLTVIAVWAALTLLFSRRR